MKNDTRTFIHAFTLSFNINTNIHKNVDPYQTWVIMASIGTEWLWFILGWPVLLLNWELGYQKGKSARWRCGLKKRTTWRISLQYGIESFENKGGVDWVGVEPYIGRNWRVIWWSWFSFNDDVFYLDLRQPYHSPNPHFPPQQDHREMGKPDQKFVNCHRCGYYCGFCFWPCYYPSYHPQQ